jgi:MoaA/NifB/PqqE/SkfB family radical SAM enzyme
MSAQDKKHNIVRFWLNKAYTDCLPYLPPVRLDISITTACNTRCAYCWQQEKSGSLLTFGMVADVIDAMCSLKPPKLNLTGGEPTIWPDFEQLLAYAKKSGITKILLCTNGYRLQKFEFAEKLVNLGVTEINISVDTFAPDKFKKLRGYDFSDFQKVLSNCILLKRRYPNIDITLASVMSKAVTSEELLEVKDFCINNNFGYFMQTFDKTDYGNINKEFALIPEERQLYARKLTWLGGRLGDVVKRNFNPFTEDSQILKCYKGITTVKLSSDGTIRFCWASRPIGNILQNSFKDIWNSDKAREMRKYIRDKKCKCNFDCDIFESLELYDYI